MQSRIPINTIITLILLIIILLLGMMMSSCRNISLTLGRSADKSAVRQFEYAKKYAPFDALIVPGIPFENGKWDRIMKARVLWSWILYKNGYVKNIIYSGAAVYSRYKESLIMGLYAQQLGIPKEHIFYDTNARHSTENVYYSYLIAKENGFKTIALGTDPYFQSPTLRSFTKKRFATHIHHIPFVMDSLKAYDSVDPTIDPASAAVENFISIIKQENFRTRFKGTMGKDIDWKKHKDERLEAL